MMPWWLDATCGGSGWDVSLWLKNDRIVGALPFRRNKKWGMNQLNMPPLTPFIEPWMYVSSEKPSERFSQEREILCKLVSEIPQSSKSLHRIHPSISNVLPFYWAGYSLSIAYTYQILDLHDLEAVWNGFRSSARREIRKAEDRFRLTVRECDSFTEFYKTYSKTFERQNLQPKIEFSLFNRVYQACVRENSCTLLKAMDSDNQIHAVVFLLHDSQSTYYLAGGGDPKLRNSGAASLVIWHSIKIASNKSMVFDFEGSMIKPIEKYFSSFGAVQKQYSCATKISSRFLHLLFSIYSS